MRGRCKILLHAHGRHRYTMYHNAIISHIKARRKARRNDFPSPIRCVYAPNMPDPRRSL